MDCYEILGINQELIIEATQRDPSNAMAATDSQTDDDALCNLIQDTKEKINKYQTTLGSDEPQVNLKKLQDQLQFDQSDRIDSTKLIQLLNESHELLKKHITSIDHSELGNILRNFTLIINTSLTLEKRQSLLDYALTNNIGETEDSHIPLSYVEMSTEEERKKEEERATIQYASLLPHGLSEKSDITGKIVYKHKTESTDRMLCAYRILSDSSLAFEYTEELKSIKMEEDNPLQLSKKLEQLFKKYKERLLQKEELVTEKKPLQNLIKKIKTIGLEKTKKELETKIKKPSEESIEIVSKMRQNQFDKMLRGNIHTNIKLALNNLYDQSINDLAAEESASSQDPEFAPHSEPNIFLQSTEIKEALYSLAKSPEFITMKRGDTIKISLNDQSTPNSLEEYSITKLDKNYIRISVNFGELTKTFCINLWTVLYWKNNQSPPKHSSSNAAQNADSDDHDYNVEILRTEEKDLPTPVHYSTTSLREQLASLKYSVKNLKSQAPNDNKKSSFISEILDPESLEKLKSALKIDGNVYGNAQDSQYFSTQNLKLLRKLSDSASIVKNTRGKEKWRWKLIHINMSHLILTPLNDTTIDTARCTAYLNHQLSQQLDVFGISNEVTRSFILFNDNEDLSLYRNISGNEEKTEEVNITTDQETPQKKVEATNMVVKRQESLTYYTEYKNETLNQYYKDNPPSISFMPYVFTTENSRIEREIALKLPQEFRKKLVRKLNKNSKFGHLEMQHMVSKIIKNSRNDLSTIPDLIIECQAEHDNTSLHLIMKKCSMCGIEIFLFQVSYIDSKKQVHSYTFPMFIDFQYTKKYIHLIEDFDTLITNPGVYKFEYQPDEYSTIDIEAIVKIHCICLSKANIISNNITNQYDLSKQILNYLDKKFSLEILNSSIKLNGILQVFISSTTRKQTLLDFYKHTLNNKITLSQKDQEYMLTILSQKICLFTRIQSVLKQKSATRTNKPELPNSMRAMWLKMITNELEIAQKLQEDWHQEYKGGEEFRLTEVEFEIDREEPKTDEVALILKETESEIGEEGFETDEEESKLEDTGSETDEEESKLEDTGSETDEEEPEEDEEEPKLKEAEPKADEEESKLKEAEPKADEEEPEEDEEESKLKEAEPKADEEEPTLGDAEPEEDEEEFLLNEQQLKERKAHLDPIIAEELTKLSSENTDKDPTHEISQNTHTYLLPLMKYIGHLSQYAGNVNILQEEEEEKKEEEEAAAAAAYSDKNRFLDSNDNIQNLINVLKTIQTESIIRDAALNLLNVFKDKNSHAQDNHVININGITEAPIEIDANKLKEEIYTITTAHKKIEFSQHISTLETADHNDNYKNLLFKLIHQELTNPKMNELYQEEKKPIFFLAAYFTKYLKKDIKEQDSLIASIKSINQENRNHNTTDTIANNQTLTAIIKELENLEDIGEHKDIVIFKDIKQMYDNYQTIVKELTEMNSDELKVFCINNHKRLVETFTSYRDAMQEWSKLIKQSSKKSLDDPKINSIILLTDYLLSPINHKEQHILEQITLTDQATLNQQALHAKLTSDADVYEDTLRMSEAQRNPDQEQLSSTDTLPQLPQKKNINNKSKSKTIALVSTGLAALFILPTALALFAVVAYFATQIKNNTSTALPIVISTAVVAVFMLILAIALLITTITLLHTSLNPAQDHSQSQESSRAGEPDTNLDDTSQDQTAPLKQDSEIELSLHSAGK